MTVKVLEHAYDCGCTACVRLKQAAPDMARVLIAVEWEETAFAIAKLCVSCRGSKAIGHRPDCALDAALRKAGVTTI